jgi:hypothetical protein
MRGQSSAVPNQVSATLSSDNRRFPGCGFQGAGAKGSYTEPWHRRSEFATNLNADQLDFCVLPMSRKDLSSLALFAGQFEGYGRTRFCLFLLRQECQPHGPSILHHRITSHETGMVHGARWFLKKGAIHRRRASHMLNQVLLCQPWDRNRRALSPSPLR